MDIPSSTCPMERASSDPRMSLGLRPSRTYNPKLKRPRMGTIRCPGTLWSPQVSNCTSHPWRSATRTQRVDLSIKVRKVVSLRAVGKKHER